MKKLILALAALSLTVSPAFAMATRPVVKVATVDPATLVAARDALYAEYNGFTACLGDPRFAQVRGTGELVQLETALNTAGVAAKAGNKTEFDAEAALFRQLLAPLKAKYGC